MIQGISDTAWQAEARTRETKPFIRDIKRVSRRKFTAEEKIRIVLEGFGHDTTRDATMVEVEALKRENVRLKQLVAEMSL